MHHVDQILFLWLNLSATAAPQWVEMAQLISLQLLHWLVAATLTVIVVGRPRWRAAAWRVLLAMVLATIAASLLKRGFNHPRPVALGLGTQWLPDGTGRSFPSAHTTVAMAWAVAAAWAAVTAPIRWPVRALILSVALAMGWSRVAVGVHFPSVVLAGWLLGTCCAWIALHIKESGRWLHLFHRSRHGAV